jgi:hypothetical protein
VSKPGGARATPATTGGVRTVRAASRIDRKCRLRWRGPGKGPSAPVRRRAGFGSLRTSWRSLREAMEPRCGSRRAYAPWRRPFGSTLRILRIFGGQAAACIGEASLAVLGLPGRARWRPTCGDPRVRSAGLRRGGWVPFKGRMMSHLRHEILNHFAASMAWRDPVAIATRPNPRPSRDLTASCPGKLSAKSLGIWCRNRDFGRDS